MNGCPSYSALNVFVDSSEPDGDTRRHVEVCAACRGLVEELRRDAAFIDRLRAAQVLNEPRPRGPAPDAAARPDLIDGYRILGEIHRGGQGVIYRAVQLPTHRTVAIKMLLADRSHSARDRERFEREARIAAGLRHPNIVTVYDGGFVADGRYAFAMEYIEGEPLDQWSTRLQRARTRDARRRALRERLTVMAKVCDAVLYAHQHAIVHRDLKPANIIVDAAGEPHVLDFGIARDLGPGAHTRLTHTGAFAGTLAYASPEQVGDDPSRADTRTDIYALGVILYQMVSGRMPYEVDGPMSSTIRNIESAEPASLRRRGDDPDSPVVDDEVATIILKALAKDPTRRYQTAAGLGNDIKRYLAGEAIEARRDSSWYVLRKFARRKRWLLGAVGITLMAIITGGFAAGYGLLRAHDERQQKDLQQARAEAETMAGRAAARLIQQTLPPLDSLDDELLGRRVRTGLLRLRHKLQFGTYAGDARADATAGRLIASVSLTPGWQAEAEVHLRQSIAALHYEYGGDHVLLAQAYHDLAAVLERRGRRVEAERWTRQAIDLWRRLSGPHDPAQAPSQHMLARLLIERGDIAAADAACEEATRLSRGQPGVEAAELASLCLTRSSIREAQRRYAEAETEAQEALVTVLTSQGDDDPLVPECLRRLAGVYEAAPGRPPDPRLAAALRVSSRAQVAEALTTAATGLERQDDSVDDRRHHAAGLEIVLSLKTAYLGESHFACAGTLALIEDDAQSIQDWTSTARAAERSVAVLQARLGAQHPALIQLHELLWQAGLCMEDLPGAIAARRRMLEIWLAQPEQARDALWIANEHRWLAFTLLLGGEFSEAEVEYRRCLDGLSAGGLTDHYLGDIATGGLGWVALHLGRPEEAEALTRRALAQYSARTNAPGDQRGWLQHALGHVLTARGKLDEAGPYIDNALAAAVNPSGLAMDCRHFALLADAIGLAERRGDEEAARRLRSQLSELRRAVQAPQSP